MGRVQVHLRVCEVFTQLAARLLVGAVKLSKKYLDKHRVPLFLPQAVLNLPQKPPRLGRFVGLNENRPLRLESDPSGERSASRTFPSRLPGFAGISFMSGDSGPAAVRNLG